MKTIIIFIVLLWPVVAVADNSQLDTIEENYCADPALWVEWEDALKRHPGDDGLRVLYALRTGVCAMVQRKELTVVASNKYFEQLRSQIIDQRRKLK